jgi:AcrR family transcriptional regulator
MLDLSQSRRPGRPRIADAANIQSEIFAAAKRLFFEHGVAATGMDAIAKAAGITKQTLYARFPNKDELYRAVIDEVMNKWRQDQGPLIGDCRNLGEALYNHSLETLDTATREGSALVARFLSLESGRSPDLTRSIIAPLRAKGIQDIKTILDTFSAPDSPQTSESADAAEFFFMCLIGKINDLNSLGEDTNRSTLATWAKTAVRLFLAGYEAR